MSTTDLDRAALDFLARLDDDGLRRSLVASRPQEGAWICRGGKRLIDFSSNDYLGLARHPALIDRARAWAEDWGTGATASRLVTGNLDLHEKLEAKIAAAKGTEAALIFNSGWQANSALLPTLTDPNFLGAPAAMFADRLIHASLHAGIAQAGLTQTRYRHNDLTHLEDMLKRHRDGAGQKTVPFIVTETVFSMDGDRADLQALIELAERYDAVLYVDEAHATGVLGGNGMGLASDFAGRIPLVMGTFGKALGSFGAYLACSGPIKDYLVNRCRGFIYSTALPPPILGAIDAALDLVPTMGPERARLHGNADRVRAACAQAGIDTGASSTQIVPAILGDAAATMDAARRLEEAGLLGVGIRPPTVPRGMARIRFSLSSNHDGDAIDRLIGQIPALAAPS
ncbi:MAG: 8-amino-7-oxononanoate synthase [Alphaproteobacteria bacterium]|nr:8-amino-7-oxononanoate synthase [Alphaproteobacteria bacterium]